MNMRIHLNIDRDAFPALYDQLRAASSRGSRQTRLLSLAQTGLVMEQLKAVVVSGHAPVPQQPSSPGDPAQPESGPSALDVFNGIFDGTEPVM